MEARDTVGGNVAVITGAGAGIGKGLARAAAELGMKLVLVDIAGDRLGSLAEKFGGGGSEVLTAEVDQRRGTGSACRSHAGYFRARELVD
jgi:NADP-dependent 3-hydroxy acid dehydrogenase YdfG